MRKNFIKNVIVFLFVISIFFYCFNSSDLNIEQKQNYEPMQNQELIFKKWLSDTLNHLRSSNTPNTEIVVSEDSLSLKTFTYYSLNISENEETKEEVTRMLSLLKEYDELPNEEFTLSFTDYMFFYLPSIENLKYDFISELQNIKILQGDTQIDYEYLRGRLTSKEVKRKNQKCIRTEFLWDRDSLKKVTCLKCN